MGTPQHLSSYQWLLSPNSLRSLCLWDPRYRGLPPRPWQVESVRHLQGHVWHAPCPCRLSSGLGLPPACTLSHLGCPTCCSFCLLCFPRLWGLSSHLLSPTATATPPPDTAVQSRSFCPALATTLCSSVSVYSCAELAVVERPGSLYPKS